MFKVDNIYMVRGRLLQMVLKSIIDLSVRDCLAL